MAVEGEHDVIENCTVTSCADQGILVAAPYSQIDGNYVDRVGGEVVGGSDGVGRGGLNHDLYTGGGETIYNNFFGRSLSGSCSQLLCWGATAPTLYYDNVCYGSTGAALIIQGGNVTATGNVLVAPQLTWRGTPLSYTGAGAEPGGLYLLYPEGNVTISGNYIEGYFGGLTVKGQYATGGLGAGGPQVTGLVITNNTIAGGTLDATFDGAVPGVMNRNQWNDGRFVGDPTPPVFSVQVTVTQAPRNDYAQFVSWANGFGLEGSSAAAVGSLIDAATYDAALGGGDGERQGVPIGVDAAIALFRGTTDEPDTGYADYQVDNYYPAAASGVEVGELDDGTGTRNANGVTFTAVSFSSSVAPNTVLVIPAPSLPAGTAIVALASDPADGVVTINANGSFTYTPDPGFTSPPSDTFTYEISDGYGGTSIGTVTIDVATNST